MELTVEIVVYESVLKRNITVHSWTVGQTVIDSVNSCTEAVCIVCCSFTHCVVILTKEAMSDIFNVLEYCRTWKMMQTMCCKCFLVGGARSSKVMTNRRGQPCMFLT